MSLTLIAARNIPRLRALAGDGPPAVGLLGTPRWRCRPGDEPLWVKLDLSRDDLAELRGVAAASGVTVDAWVSLTLELSIAAPTPDERCRIQWCLQPEQGGAFRLPEGALARWQAALLRPRSIDSVDELPEVVVPARLAEMADGNLTPRVQRELREKAWDLARCCEIAACSQGLTMAGLIARLLSDGPGVQAASRTRDAVSSTP